MKDIRLANLILLSTSEGSVSSQNYVSLASQISDPMYPNNNPLGKLVVTQATLTSPTANQNGNGTHPDTTTSWCWDDDGNTPPLRAATTFY